MPLDASELTKRRQGRVLYVNYLVRNTNVNVNPGQVARPLATGSPIGSGSGINYSDYVASLIEGTRNTTAEEKQAYLNQYFPPPPAPPTPQGNAQWSYYIVYEGDTNYMYLIYNSTTASWYAPLDTTLSLSDYSTTDNWWYPTGFAYQFEKQDYSEYVYQFVDFDVGVIKQTITIPEVGNNGFDFYGHMVIAYYTDTNPLYTLITFYNPLTNVLKTTPLLGYVYDTLSLNTSVYFVMTTDDVSYTHYIWNEDQPSPVQIAIGLGDYRVRNLNARNNMMLIMSSDGSQWTDIYYINLDGAYVTYTIPNSSDYPNDYSISRYTYGYNYKYIRLTLYNSTNDSYDYFLFNNLTPQMTTLVPLIISDITGDTNTITNGGNPYSLTGITNDMVLQTYYPRIDYILDLPFNTYLYTYGGNQCQIFINGQITDNLVTNDYEKFYGEKQQLRLDGDDTTYYGFINGTPTTHPHSMMAFVSRASEGNTDNATIQLKIKDNFNTEKSYDQYNSVAISYTSSHNRSGSIYYAGNDGGSEPSCYHVWFTVENETNWNTFIDDITFHRDTGTDYHLEAYMQVAGYNFIVVHLFLSGIDSGTGTGFTEQQITNIVTAYVSAADFMSDTTDFYTIDVVRYRNWHNANAANFVTGSYYSYFYNYAYNPTIIQLSRSLLYYSKFYYIADAASEPYIIDISNNIYVNDNTPTINNIGLGLWQCTDTDTESRLVLPEEYDIITTLFDVNRSVTDSDTNGYYSSIDLTDNIAWVNAILSLTNGKDFVYKIVNMNTLNTLIDETSYFDGYYVFSGKNLLIYNNNEQTIYKLMNGIGEVLIEYPQFINEYNYTDFGNGDLIILSYDDTTRIKVVTTTSTTFSEFRIPFFIFDQYRQSANFMMITTYSTSDNYKVVVVDTSGNIYPNPYEPYDTGITSTNWNPQLRYTDKSFMLLLNDNNTGLKHTLMFIFDTKTFVFITPQTSLTDKYIEDVHSTYPG